MSNKRKSTLLNFFKPVNKVVKLSDDNVSVEDEEKCKEKHKEFHAEKIVSVDKQTCSLSQTSDQVVADQNTNLISEEENYLPQPRSSSRESDPIITDISLFKNKPLSDVEKMNVLNNKWIPKDNFNFPVKRHGNQNRKFSLSWLKKYKWLSYSALEDSAYCTFCILFAPDEVGMTSSQSTGQLVKEGFSVWKKALDRFEQHERCRYHKDALLKANNFRKTIEGKLLPIDKVIDVCKGKQARENAEKIKPIIDTVILCGRQGIALRGHRDYGQFDINNETHQNEGNFRALLRMRIEAGNEILKKHFQICSKNATYISWNFQNQIIEACDFVIKRKIACEVNSAKYFSVLADETSDVSLIEQFSLCLRYVTKDNLNQYKICEKFLQFMPLQSTTGKDLADKLLNGLKECNIDTDNLRGQGYDGAAAMSGKFKGAQACIMNTHPTALYVHCVSHSLNLAISNATEVPAIRNCFGVIEKVWSFFNTPKRQLVLRDNINTFATETRKHKLNQLCPTRWVQRHDAVLVMVELLHPIAAALEDIKAWEDKESSTGANILLNAVSQSEFLISLVSSEKLLSYTLPLSKKLQTTDADLSSAISHAEHVVSAIELLRKNIEVEFRKIFEDVLNKADYLGTTITIPRLVKKQTHRINVPAENPEEYFRRGIFIPWIDAFTAALNDRFLKHKNILRSFNCLLPTGKSLTEEGKEAFLKLTDMYKNDTDNCSIAALHTELELWYQHFKSDSSVQDVPKNAIDALNLCDKDIFSNVHTLLKIFASLPVSTSTAERSFSTLRRIKTYLRNTMGENRLNGLANLNINREISVDNKEVISILKERCSRRLDFIL